MILYVIDSRLSCSQLRKLDSGVKNGTLVTFKIKLTKHCKNARKK